MRPLQQRLAALALLVCLGGAVPASAQPGVTLGSGFSFPSAVALDSAGNLYVADTSNDRIKQLPAAGGYGTVNTLAGDIGWISQFALDRQGDLFVIDQNANTVREFQASGGFVSETVLAGSFTSTTGIAVDRSGNVFVADYSAGTVTEILAQGGYTQTQTIGSGLVEPGNLAIDQAGDVFVIDRAGLQEIVASGGYTTVKTISSTAYCHGGIALDSADNLFVGSTCVQSPSQIALYEIPAAGGYASSKLISTQIWPAAIAVDSKDNIFVDTIDGAGVLELMASDGYADAVSIDNGESDGVATLAVDAQDNLFLASEFGSLVKERIASGGYADSTTLLGSFVNPVGLAVDGSGNLLVADTNAQMVKQIAAQGGYHAVSAIGTHYIRTVSGVALDADGNIFVADSGESKVEEIVAAGGYATVKTLGSGFFEPTGVALDGHGNLFVADGTGQVEMLAPGDGYTASTAIGTGFSSLYGIAVDSVGNVYVTDANAVKEILAAGGYRTVRMIGDGFGEPRGLAIDGAGNIFVADTTNNAVKRVSAPVPTVLVASVLPDSRSVEIGTKATIFASVINSGAATLENCLVSLPSGTPGGMTLDYQATDPATNLPVGMPNTPVSIPGGNGLQSFVLTFSIPYSVSIQSLAPSFSCGAGDSLTVADAIAGVDTVDLTFSATPVPDIIALAATTSHDGIVLLPDNGAGAFSVASLNLGAAAPITVSVDTGSAGFPVAASVCQTDPSGQCLAPPAATATLDFATNATPTFSVFLQATGSGPPILRASARIFVRFEDDSGALHGSTSVAVGSS